MKTKKAQKILGSMINAYINGADNIIRKEVGDVSIPADRGLVFSPLKINF